MSNAMLVCSRQFHRCGLAAVDTAALCFYSAIFAIIATGKLTCSIGCYCWCGLCVLLSPPCKLPPTSRRSLLNDALCSEQEEHLLLLISHMAQSSWHVRLQSTRRIQRCLAHPYGGHLQVHTLHLAGEGFR